MLDSPSGLDSLPRIPSGQTAQRLTWPHLPPPLRALVEERLGAPVVTHRSCDGGFTPGLASVLTTESGATAFVKAASVKAQAAFAASYAIEGRVLRRLTLQCPDLPATRLRWRYRDEDWVVLCFEAVQARAPQRPWQAEDLDRALGLASRIQAATVTHLDDLGLKPLAAELPELITGWAGVDRRWPYRDEVDGLARGLRDLPTDGFVHADLRDDNILLLKDGAALGCDWNWCARGPAWFDMVSLLVTAYGDGVDVEPLLAQHPLTRDVAAEDIDVALAALTGHLMTARQHPVPPTSPYLRAHQAWWAEAGWAWLARRRGWEG